jgi:tetratricopeptide (TPR) repeat protein
VKWLSAKTLRRGLVAAGVVFFAATAVRVWMLTSDLRSFDAGVELMGQKNYRGAAEYFTRSIRHHEFPEAYFNRALCYLNLERIDEAFADMERYVSLQGEGGDGQSLRGQCLEKKGGDWSAALEEYSKAIEGEPEQPQHRFNRGHAFLKAGKPEEGLGDLDEAIRLAPEKTAYRFLRALLLSDLSKPERALQDLDFAAEPEPDNPDWYWMRARVRARLGDATGALADLDREAGLHPAAAVERGALRRLIEAGALEDPLRKLNRQIAEKPDDADLHRARARHYSGPGDPAKALEDWAEASRLDPGKAGDLIGRFHALRQLGRDDEAAQELEDREPVDGEIRYLLGCLRYDQGRWEEALAELRVACASPHLQAGWRYRLWLARWRAGDGEAASAEARTAFDERWARGEMSWEVQMLGFLGGEVPEERIAGFAGQEKSLPADKRCVSYF